ncbi:MAG TPA: lipopolysaccharide heptosyltransferase I [Methylotenera sp.]|nr:lipopolysaccharide heptosyltransferase I [Methylotenera sp.]
MPRILLVKTSSLGDVIHNLPVVNDILQHAPQAHIDWLVEESFADIPHLHTGISHVFTLALRRWKKHIFSQKTWQEMAAFKQLIQQHHYDAIIDTQGLIKSALAMRYTHGTKHGYDKQSIREPLASYFYDKTYAISYQQHAVTRNRALCALSLGYAISTDAPNYGMPTERMAIHPHSGDLQSDYMIALHGTSRDSKLWPIEHWVALGKQLALQNLNMVLPWASDAEHARATIISQQVPDSVVLPKFSISELAGVIANAKAAVGVDTGLSHFAAALNIPTVAIYTDTNPALTGVMAGKFASAINLGGINQTPTVEDVLRALKPHI